MNLVKKKYKNILFKKNNTILTTLNNFEIHLSISLFPGLPYHAQTNNRKLIVQHYITTRCNIISFPLTIYQSFNRCC